MAWQQLAVQAALAGGQYYLDKRAQKKAFEQNKQFWHERFDKEAEYNSPVQQKARMQAAGLNPALMYKGGQTGGNVSGGSAPSKIAEKAQLTELARMSAEVARIKADTDRTISEKDYIESKTTGQDTGNEIAAQNLYIKKVEALAAPQRVKNELKGQLSSILKQVSEINQIESNIGLTEAKTQTQKDINTKFNELERFAISQGIDTDAGFWQTLKKYIFSKLNINDVITEYAPIIKR